MNTLHYPKRHTMLTAMVVALLISLFGVPFTGQANPLANDATVLNYLVEMERQTGKGCTDEPVTLPSLIPTPEIQELADIIATSNTTLDELLTLRGMDKASVFSAFVHAETAQEAVKKLRLANCSELLNARYTKIGSNRHGTKWTVVLAGEQRIPPAGETSDIIVNPYEPTETTAPDSSAGSPAGLTQPSPNQAAPQAEGTGPDQATRQTHGKYTDGEPVFLPERDEHRDPATPQVTGVYTDDTLTPVQNGQQGTPSAPPATPRPVQQTPSLRPQQPTPPHAPPQTMQPARQPQQPSTAPASPAGGPRKTYGKYADGEPVFLPEESEHREAATPQVTGVYTDDTLTPQNVDNLPPPPAPLAPLPDYPESNRDPNDAAPPQVTGVYTP